MNRIVPLALLGLFTACNSGAPQAPDWKGPGHAELQKAHAAIQAELWKIGEDGDMPPPSMFDQALPLMQTHLNPIQAKLNARGTWRLGQLPKGTLDRGQYTAHMADQVAELNTKLTPEVLEAVFPGVAQFTYLAWDPYRVAFMTRSQLHVRLLGAAGMGRRAMIDNLAPPAVHHIGGDVSAPILSLTSGPEVVVVHLKRQESGAFLPTKIEWLMAKAGAAEKAPEEAPEKPAESQGG